MASRIFKILFLLALLSVCIYFRFVYQFGLKANSERIIFILLSMSILLLAFRVIIDVLVVWYKIDKKHGSGRLRDNLIVGLSNLFTIFSVIALAFGLLAIFGLKPSEVFTSLSIFAAAIALISKDFIAEIIVGIYNGFSTKIELDDYVKVGEQKGKIIDLGLQKVTLLSDDDDVIYIPNLKFYNEDIINYTKRDIRSMSVDFSVEPRYISNLGQIERALSTVLLEFKDHLTEGYELKVASIDKESVTLKFQYTLKSVSRDVQRQIRKKLMKKMLQTISEQNNPADYKDDDVQI
jgi:small-conductance mechanosensitive channel